MTHEEALNLMLANNCPSTVSEDGHYTFLIDLHCIRFEIVATLAGTLDTIRYDIVTCQYLND